MEAKVKRARVVGVKYSKAGCQTCRIRRVKCDEARPACQKCISTGRKCDGYVSGAKFDRGSASRRPLLPANSSSNASRRPLLPTDPVISSRAITILPSPSDVSFSIAPDDRKSFVFFAQHMAVGISYISPGKEWVNLALQMALTEPALYYAVSAVGSIALSFMANSHRKILSSPLPVEHGPSLQQYCKATASLQKYINQAITRQASVEPILLCCLFFVLYEIYQGENSLALSHLRLGRRAIEDCLSNSKYGETGRKRLQCLSVKAVNEILATFDMLGAEPASRSHSMLSPGDHELKHEWNSPSPGFSIGFASIEQAKQSLDGIIAAASRWQSELVLLAEEMVAGTQFSGYRKGLKSCIAHCISRFIELEPRHHLLRRQTQLLREHETWLAGISAMKKLHGDTIRRRLILMELQHFYSAFNLQTARETNDMYTDKFDHHFGRALDLVDENVLGSRLPGPQASKNGQKGADPYNPFPQREEFDGSSLRFSLEYSILPVLFLVSLKCRAQSTRKRALTLLHTINRREGLQWSGEWVNYADSLIALEESLAFEASGACDHIPAEARISDTVIENGKYLEIDMICGRFRVEGDGKLEITEYRGAGLPPLRLKKMVQHVLPFTI